MLTKLLAISPRPSIPDLVFDILDAHSDSIQLQNFEGLGPVNAEVNTTPYGSIDGEAYNGAGVNKRNIVLTFGLNPNWVDQTMAVLRQNLYRYFMPKMGIKLRFFNDHLPEAEISGYVESFEPQIFSRDPQIQVSILCPDPYFMAVDPTIVTGTSDSVNIEIDYEGTVETGVIFQIGPGVDFEGTLSLANEVEETQMFEATLELVSADQLQMSSVAGSKYFRAVDPDNGIINQLKTIGTLDDWIQLSPGVNEFTVVTDPTEIDWTLSYFARFGGL